LLLEVELVGEVGLLFQEVVEELEVIFMLRTLLLN